MQKKLVILLDAQPKEKLNSGGGQLLRNTLARLSIPRTEWVHDYCYLGNEKLPTKKVERMELLSNDLIRVKEFVRLNRPCIIVGLGRLACEVLTGASILSTRVGTCWPTEQDGKVWIGYSPEGTLYNPTQVVCISRVIRKAAERAGIRTEFNPKIPMFNFEPYEKKHYL